MAIHFDSDGKPHVANDSDPGAVQPKPPGSPAPTTSGFVLLVLAFVFGSLLLAAGLGMTYAPVYHGDSFADAHQLCHSGLGEMAQAFDKDTQNACTVVNWVFRAGWAALVVGALLLGSGLYAMFRRQRQQG